MVLLQRKLYNIFQGRRGVGSNFFQGLRGPNAYFYRNLYEPPIPPSGSAHTVRNKYAKIGMSVKLLFSAYVPILQEPDFYTCQQPRCRPACVSA